ncbi:DUF998 domain-containing protein [Streptomyces sp. PTM05]|uniref:DUF998 domain-containing protein n=1 Tax=Streptantibioticus parmotrematis TaxID=2873249 RepID=A0ABS7QWB9_9ACTN|nr:DUF998 domain-containing protein [Streptantibioticus parmotrematis]MBY8886650.1 DUF998 domain-containing protein [Streptantibioticus parmotrematis]
MLFVPWWALVSSGFAPVALVAGWWVAEALQGPAYDPVTQTISVLAAVGAPGYWVMTSTLIALGVCHLLTARGLRPAAPAGRLALAGGGVAAIALTLVPAPVSGGSLRHGAVVVIGFALLALWPVLAAGRGAGVPWGLRPVPTLLVSALMCAGAGWFVLTLLDHGPTGVAERVLTEAQTLWPLVVVVSCPRGGTARATSRSPGQPRGGSGERDG